jgi:nucleoside-triphosphatase THEP1
MNKQLYFRLIALWVLCEAMLGGIIHGFNMPVSGLVVGSCAVTCICLIAWYVPGKGAIIKATIIVAIFKMMLSPQTPPPAYIAVFFQGLLGELLFRRNHRFFRLSCIVLAVLALLESGLQRILMLTIVYGNDIWKVINNFINGLTKQKVSTNYSLLIGGGYVLLHLVTGLAVGWWASVLPGRIETWSRNKQLSILVEEGENTAVPVISRRRRRMKMGLFIIWVLLIALYVQSYYKIGTPLLSSHISLKIFLRSIIIVFSWIFIVGPLVKKLLHKWLQRKQTQWQQDIRDVLRLLPVTQQLAAKSWKQAAEYKGWKRVINTAKLVLVNALHPVIADKIVLLSAPIHSGKTTSLVKWSANRADVYGILTPEVSGKRMFMDAHSRQLFLMEAKEGDAEIITVGKFVFSKSNFEKANQIIREGSSKKGWLVIDEIGPLELRGEGFSPVLKEVLAIRQEKILLVIRDKDDTVEKVKQYFGINNAAVINSIDEAV